MKQFIIIFFLYVLYNEYMRGRDRAGLATKSDLAAIKAVPAAKAVTVNNVSSELAELYARLNELEKSPFK